MPGDSVTLPCRLPSARLCSQLHWNASIEHRRIYREVARGGVVTATLPPWARLGANCSLHIDRLELASAGMYVCGDGQSTAAVSLEVLQSKHLDRLNNSHRDLKLNSAWSNVWPFSCRVSSVLAEKRWKDGDSLFPQ